MSGNGEYGAARADVLAGIREHARDLASQDLLAREIAHRLDHGLTATERELLGEIVRQAVAEARRTAAQASGSADQPSLQRPVSIGGGTRFLHPVVPVVLAAVAVGVLVGLALSSRRHEEGTPSARDGAGGVHRSAPASRGNRESAVSGRGRTGPSPPKSSPAPPPAPPAPGSQQGGVASQTGVASAAQLNDRGFQLMNAGSYAEAIPLLRRAVSASAPDRKDLTHAYALFNLGRALRLVGRPEEAVPVLEQRLRIDNQRATVSRELRAAQRSVPSTGGAR